MMSCSYRNSHGAAQTREDSGGGGRGNRNQLLPSLSHLPLLQEYEVLESNVYPGSLQPGDLGTREEEGDEWCKVGGEEGGCILSPRCSETSVPVYVVYSLPQSGPALSNIGHRPYAGPLDLAGPHQDIRTSGTCLKGLVTPEDYGFFFE